MLEGVVIGETHSHFSHAQKKGRCPGCRGTGMNAPRKRKEREVGRMGGRPCVPTAVFPSLTMVSLCSVCTRFLWLKLTFSFLSFF